MSDSLSHSLWRLVPTSGLLDPVTAIYRVFLRCRENLMFTSIVIEKVEEKLFCQWDSCFDHFSFPVLSLLFSMCLSFIENEKCPISRTSKLCDMISSRILGIGSSPNVMLARCREYVSLSTRFLLRTYSRYTINITFSACCYSSRLCRGILFGGASWVSRGRV